MEVLMNRTNKIALLIAATAALSTAAGGWALAAEQSPPPASQMGGGMPMGQGMMGHGGTMGQDGMMGMMQHCQKMMGGAGMAGTLVPQLPPGNDKLQLKMQAEIMQKVGEIAARYADQVKEAR